MAKTNLLVPPIRTPILNDVGELTRPWVVFLEQLAKAVQVNATNAVALFKDITLPDGAGTTTLDESQGIPVSTIDGELFALVIQQNNPTGGHEIALGSIFDPNISIDIDMLPASLTKLILVGYGGIWYDWSRA